ncbi:MAG: sensor domain-containing diguanylate cyclase [Acidobacteria bacterium]|nr:MAG: sensor domain-containing diguanylate cyclase [Acidobacteriota bacterium]
MDHRTLEQRARAFEHVFDAVVVTDLEGNIVDWNVGAEKLYGWSREEAVGQPVSILHVKDEPDRTAEVLSAVEKDGKWAGEIKMQHRDETIGWIESVVVPLLDDDGQPCGALGINRDITRRVHNEEELVRLATTDPLTGLPNRGLLLDRLEGTLRRAERRLHCFALLFIDLDDFKEINDHGGHLVGDRVLKEVAQDLATALRDCDTVARIGGDEFAVLIEDCSGIDDARDVGAKVLQAVKRSIEIDGAAHRLTASVGIAVYPSDGHEVSTLLGHADEAMYRAKTRGGNWCE